MKLRFLGALKLESIGFFKLSFACKLITDKEARKSSENPSWLIILKLWNRALDVDIELFYWPPDNLLKSLNKCEWKSY